MGKLIFFSVKNMIKILTCHCKRNHLNQLNINYTYVYSFDDCCCCDEHKVFAGKCNEHWYNLVGFARKFFASVLCYCYRTDRNMMCRHFKQLLYNLNFNTMKVCLSERDVSKEFKLLDLEKYLEMCLKANPTFFYSKENNSINIFIDAIDWGGFFVINGNVNRLFYFVALKVMAIFEVDLIFCCPVSSVIFLSQDFRKSKKKIEFSYLYTGDTRRSLLILKILKGKIPCLFVALIIWKKQYIWTLLTVSTTTNLYSVEMFWAIASI